VPVHHLAEIQQSLEHAYLRLTEDSVDHHGHSPVPTSPQPNGASR
jgi:ABC-2 type transport system ATP-binding protein